MSTEAEEGTDNSGSPTKRPGMDKQTSGMFNDLIKAPVLLE
jgi:hypothetical protein